MKRLVSYFILKLLSLCSCSMTWLTFLGLGVCTSVPPSTFRQGLDVKCSLFSLCDTKKRKKIVQHKTCIMYWPAGVYIYSVAIPEGILNGKRMTIRKERKKRKKYNILLYTNQNGNRGRFYLL